MNKKEIIRLQISECKKRVEALEIKLREERYNLAKLRELDGSGDYVKTALLSEQINLWRKRDGKNTILQLSRKTGLHDRYLRTIINCETVFTSETNADKVLVEIGREYMLGNEIALMKRPDPRVPYSHCDD